MSKESGNNILMPKSAGVYALRMGLLALFKNFSIDELIAVTQVQETNDHREVLKEV